MPLLTQPDSQNSPPLTLPLAGRMEGTWGRADPRQNLSTGGTSLLDSLELPVNIPLNGFGKQSRPFGASSGEMSLRSSSRITIQNQKLCLTVIHIMTDILALVINASKVPDGEFQKHSLQ